MNSMPEWFTADPDAAYAVKDLTSGETITLKGTELHAGLPITLETGTEKQLLIRRKPLHGTPKNPATAKPPCQKARRIGSSHPSIPLTANPALTGAWKTIGTIPSPADFDPAKPKDASRAPVQALTFQSGGATGDPL
jgi:hypothetical protein